MKTILLLPPNENLVTFKLFENDIFIITTTPHYFQIIMEEIFNKAVLNEDVKLLNMVNSELTKNNLLVDVYDIAKRNKLSERLYFRLSDLLVKGMCTLFDKIEGEYVKELIFEIFNSSSSGGKKFYANDKCVLETLEWIS